MVDLMMRQGDQQAAEVLLWFRTASTWPVPRTVPELLELESRWRRGCRRLGVRDADSVQLLFREALGLTPADSDGRY